MFFLQVNTNGAISFTTPISQFTSDPFPLNGTLQLIAAFWADVDTRGTGTVWYREVNDARSPLLAITTGLLQNAFPSQPIFTPTSLFIATWDRVGYFNRRTDKVAMCDKL